MAITIYHASFTYDGNTVKFGWFTYDGDLDLIRSYRQQRQSGSQGAESIQTYRASRQFNTVAGVTTSDLATLKAMESELGTLTIRGTELTGVRLNNVFKLRGVTPISTVDGSGNLSTTYNETELRLVFTIESE